VRSRFNKIAKSTRHASLRLRRGWGTPRSLSIQTVCFIPFTRRVTLGHIPLPIFAAIRRPCPDDPHWRYDHYTFAILAIYESSGVKRRGSVGEVRIISPPALSAGDTPGKSHWRGQE
jgi:hypothetical protein